MKKNWLQAVTLCLCIILLIITIGQSLRLNEYQRQLDDKIDNLSGSFNNEIQNISSNIERELEKSNQVISEYTLEPTGIDNENRALLANVSVTLKEWYENTEMTLLPTVGENHISIPMTTDGNGTFTGQLSLSLENNYEIFLDALIAGGGLNKQEKLGGWSDISMLLPLQIRGGGWSGPEYRNGMLSSQYHITIEGQNGKTPFIQNPEFLIYKNNVLIQTLTAVIDPNSTASNAVCYTVDTQDNIWSIECDVSNVIDIRFRCVDEYGLGYDFLFKTWVVNEEITENQAISEAQSSESNLTMYWLE